MDKFIARFGPLITAVLSGFDRVHPTPHNASERDIRRLSAKTSRLLRLLRAHRVIRKIPKTRRYRLTDRGQLLTAALFATRTANITQLLAKAA